MRRLRGESSEALLFSSAEVATKIDPFNTLHSPDSLALNKSHAERNLCHSNFLRYEHEVNARREALFSTARVDGS